MDQVPLNVTLPMDLGGGDLAQWYDALCAAKLSLYDQLKPCNFYGPIDLHLKTALWKLLFRLNVAEKAQPLRKNVGLILDVLAQHEDSASALRIVAATELSTFLETLWMESKVDGLTPDRRVVLLDQMLHVVESPFLARILVENPVAGSQSGDARHLLQFVTHCADHLEALVAPVLEYHETNLDRSYNEVQDETEVGTASTNVVLIASERSGHALKCVIVLASMKEVLDSRLGQCRGISLESMMKPFMRILKPCVLLLKTTVVHKDLLTQSGIAYCLVLRLLLRLTVKTADVSNMVTKLLLQTAYPEMSIVSSDTCASSQLRAHIENDVKSFGDLSRLTLYRGLLNSLSSDHLALSAKRFGLDEKDSKHVERSVLDAIFSGVQHFCKQEAYTTRLYAFQVLEALLRKAVLTLQNHLKETRVSSAPSVMLLSAESLTKLTTSVLLNWEHPSKKVNQFMAVVFGHIVNYLVLSAEFKEWRAAILPQLVELPSTSRAKYGSLLSLVEKTGAKPVLQASPQLLSSLLLAIGQKHYAAPAAANLFARILDDFCLKSSKMKGILSDDETVVSSRQFWLPNVVSVLTSSDANLRSHVAMYLIPLLLKKDPDCMPVLIQQLQDQGQMDEESSDVALWAELEVLKFARKKMALVKLIGLSLDGIERGLCHAKVETRGTAFDALCASLKSTSMPPDEELRLLKYYLVVNGKEIDPAGRMSMLIGLKTVFIRIKETLRITSKSIAKQQPCASAHGAAARRDYAAAASFKHWVELFIVASVYPGALPSRLTLGLEIFLLYVQLFGFGNNGNTQARSLLFTGQMVTTLFHMLLRSWDAIRSLAFTILDMYPDEFPSYSSRTKLCTLVNWAVGLCDSPRQRESDAGAMFVRLLFQKCCSSIQRYGIALQSVANSVSETISVSVSPEVAFVLQLTQVIIARVEALSEAEIQRGKSSFVHGFLLSLHYVLENVSFKQLSEREAAEWARAMEQIFTAVHQSMKASLAVVGDAASGAGDEPISGSFAGVVGEVSAVGKASSSALRVDCRGHLIIEGCSNNGEKQDGEDTEQSAVVSSWLAARECGAIIELLMKRVPLPELNPGSDRIPLFSVKIAQRGGETLLNSLFELKHKGAVAMAYQAFEGVCRAFLAHGEQNELLGNLPARWADHLLERLERSEQHFILRRSSGFAFSFVAILRAEPRNSAAVILPKVMTKLLQLAGEDTDAAEKRATHETHHLLWRARVHALNILKLICEDGVLAEDVARYVVDMFELAVRGFESGSWAVRNSSMMLFAAATQRAIGDKRIADGRSCQKVASDNVFSRFQTLRGFLARELTRLIENDISPSRTCEEAASPGLFPLLLFLSRLRPSIEDDAANARAGLASFVPLVMKCASHPTMAVRHMAAKVLASIISDAEAANVLSVLCSNLPQGVRRARNDSTPTKGLSHNAVHGILVQIRSLVTKFLAVKNGRNTTMENAQSKFLELIVTKLLPSTMWLWAGAHSGLVNAVVRAEIVATLDIVVHYYTVDPTHALSLLKSVSVKEALLQSLGQVEAEVECQLLQRCDMEQEAALRLSTQPGMYMVDRALVSIWFSLWSLRDRSQPLNTLLKMLASKVLQIRKKAIKQLSSRKVIETMSSNAVAELQAALIDQFLVETHPKVRRRQLQLLIRCQLSEAVEETHTLRLQLQNPLTRIFSVSADAHVLAPGLELFALMVSNQPFDQETEIALYETLCHEIEMRSDESQPLCLRQAAASALHHSGLLRLHIKKDGNKRCGVFALAGWMSALRLLQDDNVRVRAEVRQVIHKVLNAVDSMKGRVSDATLLPYVVEYITASFAHSDYGAATLSRMLIQHIDVSSVLTAYWGNLDLSCCIFEPESSNYFAECDVLAQNMVYSLFARSNEAHESMCALRRQLLAVVGTALRTLNQEARGSGEDNARCLGNITYYPDVFAPLFGLCAAGVAIVTSMPSLLPDDLQVLVSQVHEAAQEVHDIFSNDGVTHPLLLLALRLLANKDQVKSNQGNKIPVRELLYLTPHWIALA
ncbi:hypothetical protein PsorP6_019151 [Peronosclerospora sorghi]|nr:hypothetical protein PsorP6_019151 [Peronosclerospora sorghi]